MCGLINSSFDCNVLIRLVSSKKSLLFSEINLLLSSSSITVIPFFNIIGNNISESELELES